jgi:hypothetical protein
MLIVMFAMSASAVVTASNVVELVPLGVRWKYLDDGSDPGPFWRIAVFNDNGWLEGEGRFGYGNGDDRTFIRKGNPEYITHHFRYKFSVLRPSEYTNLLFQVIRDDGVVVYLNDREMFRMNMPDGPVDTSTLAAGQVSGDDETTYFETNVSAAWLVSGTNIVAVELHQSNATPTDARFDLALTGIGPVERPRIGVQRQGAQVALVWAEEGFVLEQRELPMGNWSWLTNAVSPYEIPPGGSRLFRLRSR